MPTSRGLPQTLLRGFTSLALLLVALGILIVVGTSWYATRHVPTELNQAVGQTVTTTTPSTIPSGLPLQPTTLTFNSGKSVTLQLPAQYSIALAAQGFRALRFMALSPDHRLFIGELTSASDTHTGRVLVLDGFNEQTGTFASSHVYLDNLRNPNSVAFYRDQAGQEWLYIALTDRLLRYPYAPGDTAPTSAPQVLATFPDFGASVADGGWHLTRTLAFDENALYVSVGSSCNSCEELPATRADILEMNPDGSDSRVYASGLRNAVGITYAEGALYATANEVDHLGADKPNDLVYKIRDGTNYGWPYCYEYDGAVYADTTQAWQAPYACAQAPLAFAELAPHSAPLGLAYFGDTFADAALQDAFLVAEHGSGKPSIATGYEVSLVRSGTSTPFVGGFLLNGVRQGRPVDILQLDDRSFFITDDLNGAVYYVRYTG